MCSATACVCCLWVLVLMSPFVPWAFCLFRISFRISSSTPRTGSCPLFEGQYRLRVPGVRLGGNPKDVLFHAIRSHFHRACTQPGHYREYTTVGFAAIAAVVSVDPDRLSCYQFLNVGVDRHRLKEGCHQVMLATPDLIRNFRGRGGHGSTRIFSPPTATVLS